MFACSGTVDGTAQPTRYRIRSGVTVLQLVGENISDLVTVNGIDAALVFGDSHVTDSPEGHRERHQRQHQYFQDAMNAPPAHISLACKYMLDHFPFVWNVVDRSLM